MTENEFSGATPEKLYKAVVLAGNKRDELKDKKEIEFKKTTKRLKNRGN